MPIAIEPRPEESEHSPGRQVPICQCICSDELAVGAPLIEPLQMGVRDIDTRVAIPGDALRVEELAKPLPASYWIGSTSR